MGEELVDCFFVMLEVEFHVCGGEGEYEGIEEIPYGGRGESINEVAKTMVVKEVEDDKACGIRCSIGKVIVGAISG